MDHIENYIEFYHAAVELINEKFPNINARQKVSLFLGLAKEFGYESCEEQNQRKNFPYETHINNLGFEYFRFSRNGMYSKNNMCFDCDRWLLANNECEILNLIENSLKEKRFKTKGFKFQVIQCPNFKPENKKEK